jgi:lysophospholipase L1-like esterase
MTKEEPLELLQDDGLHFSKKGYQLLGKLINNELRKKEVK